MEEFTVGDTVRLKSGGPKMTVDSNMPGDRVYCQWFAGSKLESGSFPKASLEQIRPEMGKES